jgi:hypothetical protein
MRLNRSDAALAGLLDRVVAAIVTQAVRSPQFAASLTQAIGIVPTPMERDALVPNPDRPAQGARPKNRRSPGIIDPFAILAAHDEAELRTRLAQLNLEELRDIIAEHAMDQDRLAMKWKDRNRVIDRIVERVTARAAKGSAFRAGR